MIALAAALLLPLVWLSGVQGPHRMAARDRALWLGLWLGVAWLCWHEPFLGVASALVCSTWHSRQEVGRVLTWAGVVAAWFVGLQLGPWAGVLGTAWPVIGALEAVACAAHWWRLQRGDLSRADPLTAWPNGAGTFGHRTMAAGFLALVLPLAVASPGAWILAPLVVLGLAQTFSWAALIAAGCGLLVSGPLWVAVGAVGALGCLGACLTLGWRSGRRWLASWTTRGDSLDSVGTRWRTWCLLWHVWRRWPVWLVGRGLGTTQRDLVYAWNLWPERGPYIEGHAHNEAVEWVYETGVLGLVALGLFAWRLAPQLALGDPWTGVVVAGAVLMLGTHGARVVPVGGTWWLACALVAGR